MSIVVSQEPEDYTPGSSPQIFSASSNQTGQPNFGYTIVCTDIITSETQTYNLPARADGDVVFDARPFSELYLDHYIPENLYGWQVATGVRKIRVNIGETYGTNPAYASGSNIDFIVWNAILDWKDYPNYNPADFVYDNTTDNVKYLNSGVDEDTFSGRSNYLYALTSQVDDIYALEIKTYDANGVVIDTHQIANPNVASSDYREKYLCIDVGHKGLTNIASGDVDVYPIMTDDVAYYVVSDIYDNGSGFTITPLKTIYVKCEQKYDVYTVHYLTKAGAFQTLNFQKLSVNNLTKEQTTYSKLPYTYSGGVYSYEPSARVKFVLNSDRRQVVSVNSDWLTEEQVEYHQDLLDSPIIYFDFGTTDYLQVVLNTSSYRINKKYNEKLYSLSMEFEYAHSNTRQVG